MTKDTTPAALTIYTREGHNGASIARAFLNGNDYETTSARSSATLNLCRVLRSTGADGPYQVIQESNGTLSYSGDSWHRLGSLTVQEGDSIGPKLARYRASPFANEPTVIRVRKTPGRKAGEAYGRPTERDAVEGCEGLKA